MPESPAPPPRAMTDGESDSAAEEPGRLARLWRSRRRVVLAVAAAVAVAATVMMLLPVLAAPVNADDRYWYLRAGPSSGGGINW